MVAHYISFFWFMNELLFFGQVFVVILFILFLRRKGVDTLMTLCALFSLLANLFVLKQTKLFGLEVTCSDAYAVGCTLALSLIQQDGGKKAAQKAMWLTFGSLVIFALLSQIHLFYVPGPHDTTQSNYYAILQISPRLLIASLISYFISQWIDIEVFGWMRSLWIKKKLFIPLLASALITQLIDTILFSFLGLYGVISPLWDIILFSYIIKALVAFLMVGATFFYKEKTHAV